MKTLARLLMLPLVLALSTMAEAGPRFADRAGALPATHVYSGGWEHFVGGGVATFDCNGDARPDILAAGGEHPMTLFINQTRPGADLAFALGDFPAITGATGAYPLDIDGDGQLDLAILRAGANMILKGGPGCSFTDATAAFGIVTQDDWTTAFSATWEPGNDLPTLAFGNYVNRADPNGPFQACDTNLVYRPAGGRYGPPLVLEPGYCALSVLFSDYSRRGRADLRLSNDRHYYVKGGHEQMWRPEEARFLGVADGWQDVSIWGMGIASRDVNGDAMPDVMLTSMGDQLLQFQGQGGFGNAPFETGATAHRPFTGDDGRPSTGWHAAFGDVDNDGRADIFIAKGNVDQMPGSAMFDPNNLLMGRADGTYSEAAAEAGIATGERSRGAALVDLNADGLLDLVVVNRRAPLELWQNVTAQGGHWAAILPRQPGANPDAVGAWVELRTAAGVQVQEVTLGGGHAGGSVGPLHFGLGEMTGAEVRVTWPDGAVSAWMPVRLDATTPVTRAARP